MLVGSDSPMFNICYQVLSECLKGGDKLRTDSIFLFT